MRLLGMGYSIGYWADTKTYTQTHIHELGKPVCGSKFSKKKSYQWCANLQTLTEHYKDYVECEHCKKWLGRQ